MIEISRLWEQGVAFNELSHGNAGLNKGKHLIVLSDKERNQLSQNSSLENFKRRALNSPSETTEYLQKDEFVKHCDTQLHTSTTVVGQVPEGDSVTGGEEGESTVSIVLYEFVSEGAAM